MHIYLLSVLTTIAAGATLAADYLVDRVPVLEPLRRFAASSRAKGTLGAIVLVIGFVKLFWRAPGEVIIVGDFLPAISGMLLGAMLMIDRFQERRLPEGSVEQGGGVDQGGRVDQGGGVDQVVGDEQDQAAAAESSDSGATGIARIDETLRPYRTPLGLAGIGVGVIHFLLASVLFL